MFRATDNELALEQKNREIKEDFEKSTKQLQAQHSEDLKLKEDNYAAALAANKKTLDESVSILTLISLENLASSKDVFIIMGCFYIVYFIPRHL